MKVVIIDGNNYASIAYHRAYGNIKKSNPEHIEDWSWVGGGFAKIFKSMLEKLLREMKPPQSYIVWDTAGGTSWRKELFPEYKGTRNKNNPFLGQALSLGREIAGELDVCNVAYPETEADDAVYALAKVLSKRPQANTILVSRDADFLQIVQEGHATMVWDPVRKKALEVPPYSLNVYKALVGDPSDNLSGVRGIGPKTAIRLIKEGLSSQLLEQIDPVLSIIALSRNPNEGLLLDEANKTITTHERYLGFAD